MEMLTLGITEEKILVAGVLPFDAGGRIYSYIVPPAMAGKICKGQLVRVPLGNSTRQGVIWSVPEETVYDGGRVRKLRAILQLCQETPVLSPDLLELMAWISAYYAAPLNSVLETVLPVVVRSGVRAVVHKQLRLERHLGEEDFERLKRRAPRQAALYNFLSVQKNASVGKDVALKGLGISPAVCKALVDAGIVGEISETVSRDVYMDGLSECEAVIGLPPVLNPGQQAALDVVCEELATGHFHARLLHGVTGSGKTEVYIGAIREVLRQGGSAIFLVPEVALTPQTVGRLRQRLADMEKRIVVWHSHLSAGERFDAWMAMARGEVRLVVGARSAVFAPLHSLRLIVVDEEHEPSYKQGETPFYHGRDVAVYRAKLDSAVALLGSATPALESLANVHSGKYSLSRLLTRVDDRALPALRIVDMKREVLNTGGGAVLSRQLVEALRARLDRREQSILFLNRRGFSRSMICTKCGFVAGCPHCSLALTYHLAGHRLHCHACGHKEPVPASCPACHSPGIKGRGPGTQKLEDILRELFPVARIMRLDADTMGRKNLFREVLADFRRGRLDILLGTQMLAKGLDFPNVTLVGVVDADLSLHVPDFRAAERTFQLLVQVAGRAGRGDRAGEVFVQTFTPDAAPIQFARRADFDGFFETELEQRKEHAYPPTRHLIRHLFRGRNEDKVKFYAENWVRFFEAKAPGLVEIRGPAACPLERLQDHYRWHAWYFTERVTQVVAQLQILRSQFTFDSDVADIVDVDAIDLG
ncbi:MAG: primosomal protein N' [Puniceicoccales bacterium]|jgi:primosomal protein N' (replication factor Y)|nr:primosomal protein N' [Puniceicoccales bacterium]